LVVQVFRRSNPVAVGGGGEREKEREITMFNGELDETMKNIIVVYIYLLEYMIVVSRLQLTHTSVCVCDKFGTFSVLCNY